MEITGLKRYSNPFPRFKSVIIIITTTTQPFSAYVPEGTLVLSSENIDPGSETTGCPATQPPVLCSCAVNQIPSGNIEGFLITVSLGRTELPGTHQEPSRSVMAGRMVSQ